MFRCSNCGTSTVSQSDFKGKFEDKKRQAARLMEAGHPLTEIVAVLGISYKTLREIEPNVVRKRCQCGQVALHKRKCSVREARKTVPQIPKWVTDTTVLAGRLKKGRKNQKGEVKVIDLQRAFEKSRMTKTELARRLGWTVPNITRVNKALGYAADVSSRGRRNKPRRTMTYELACMIAEAMGASYHEVGI